LVEEENPLDGQKLKKKGESGMDKVGNDWPLSKIKILDFSQAVAGPSCSLVLADMGADVVKVEPPGGDHFRPAAAGCLFVNYNRNKRGIVVNLKKEGSREIVWRMAERADVLLENFVPGTMDKLGLGWETVSKLNPRLVYCSISGFGQQGAYRGRPAYDPILQAMSGIMEATGEADRPPVRILPAMIDYTAGLNAAFAIVVSLMERMTTGKGKRLDIALMDVALTPMGPYAAKFKRTGELPARAGSAQPAWVPYQNFETQDGLLLIAVSTDPMWQKICKALKLEGPAADPRFSTLEGRRQHRTEIIEAIRQVTRRFKRDDLERILLEADVPCGKVLNVGEIIADPNVQARGILEEVDYPTMGRMLTVRTPIFFGGQTAPTRRNAPLLGEHTEELLKEAGYAGEEIQRFLVEGVVKQYGFESPKQKE
jgi:crotonobetainyl-CoA:carnitine CoA-transferase CaiB-like acyl-CoA transferase